MGIFALVAMASMAHQAAAPVLWLNTDGYLYVDGHQTQAVINDVSPFRTPQGIGFNFHGPRNGILLPDLPLLRLTGSMTVAVWVYPRDYGKDVSGAQILFRGDDRNGFDPYFLRIEHDNTMTFTIENDQSTPSSVKAELPLNQWSHITASFDAAAGELKMWLNGNEVAFTKTTKRPFSDLIPRFTPGIGIGNVQNNHGPDNQPFNGMLADLRLYDQVLDPYAAGFGVSRQVNPR